MDEQYIEAGMLAEIWGVTKRRIQMMCSRGEIAGARKEGNVWVVPADSKKPVDKRVVSGDYRKERVEVDRTNGYGKIMSLLCREIRTDLDAIIGYSNMIKNSEAGVEGCLENILTAGGDCLCAIQNVSVWENLKTVIRQDEEDSVCVKATLEALVQGLSRKVAARSIKFYSVIALEPFSVQTNREQFEIIFRNILDCAIRVADIGSTLTFKADLLPSKGHDTKLVRYTVEGNGGRLIEESLQYEVTKVLAEKFGGELEVENEPGRGTKVTLVLRHRCARASEAGAGGKEVSLDGKKILLVEDNQFSREITKLLLEQEGATVDTAEDGIIGVAKVRMEKESTYDFILMDLVMPNMDGFTATKIIKGLEDRSKASVPIIAMTANAFAEDKAKALEAGMDGHITKPINLDELKKILA